MRYYLNYFNSLHGDRGNIKVVELKDYCVSANFDLFDRMNVKHRFEEGLLIVFISKRKFVYAYYLI